MGNDEALRGVVTLERDRSAAEVNGVEYDSRRIEPQRIFVAMRGGATDGNRFISNAVGRGAPMVVTDSHEVWESAKMTYPETAFCLVENGRRALAGISANIFGHPEQKLALSAVTGTNGKTTTSYLLEGMLRSVARTCVLIGTIEYHVGDEVRVSPHTTPESRDVLELFADGVKVGASEAVMEMSSHALEQERVWGLPVDVAIFTNLTQDHLDYHGTMEKYFAAKARLFEGVGAPPPRVAVINLDDPYGSEMMKAFRGGELMTYGIGGPEATHGAFDVRYTPGGTRFAFDTPDDRVRIESPLSGRVNVSNLLAAMCAALARGLTIDEISEAVKKLKSVPGRFEVVDGSHERDFTVVVDYAHTDDALRNLIALARDLVKERGGRVITLFGCGGDRDRTKRPKMGRAAGEGSDLVVLTSDNPRSEEPMAIIDEALVGVRETGTTCIVEEDRAGAIEIAIRAARL